MYDGGKIIIGLIIGLLILLFPFLYDAGKAAKVPEPELTDTAKEAKECVLPKSEIRVQHMKLLDEWRQDVVRDAERVYTRADGRTFDKSLQNTCMNCHSNKSKFCDQCHIYMGVAPFCWDCHVEPKENE